MQNRWLTVWRVRNKLDFKGNRRRQGLESQVASKDKSEKKNYDNQDHRHKGRHRGLAAHIVHAHLENYIQVGEMHLEITSKVN